MTEDEITILKFFATSENVSVWYYNGGKVYSIPSPAFFLDDDTPLAARDGYTNVYIDCNYQLQLGIPFLVCKILNEYMATPLEEIVIPLNQTKLTKHQRAILSLINTCSKRVIALEMSRNKYAITSAIESMQKTQYC